MTPAEGKRLIELKNEAIQHFTLENWIELGALTGQLDYVRGHGRLLRSLSWGDPDYGGHVLSVMTVMIDADPSNFTTIEGYIDMSFGGGGVNVSSAASEGPRVYFRPSVFQVPTGAVEPDLVSLMMPFEAGFRDVHAAVVSAASSRRMRCQRVDDIWIHSTVIQDVFSLIFRSQIVVCDFTGKNPNVMYEAGIAHTLGKHVIPITQHPGDIPFDLQSHRYLQYQHNAEGHATLSANLANRIETLQDLQ